ncbi:hypothetical protein DN745_13385 [Bradymonas sediminis]|uniref:HTH tetR-type domain-containing protein n=2 Tax=Bradymonas sediminis TaxID=1548548 RepID=A0A2Z4FMS2_9DELT|nr:hypothetical protein DN745_13385 [Bradymonas sediminis]
MTYTNGKKMTQPTRQRLGRSEAREMILEAAARVFNQKGRALTVEDIAQEADYSTSALYKHFSNKEDILHTLWVQVGERMAEIFQSEPPVELHFTKRLKWTFYGMAKMAEDTREFFLAGMANTPMGAVGCEMESAYMDHYRTMRSSMIALMQRGIDEGVLRPNPAELYSMALGGHLHSVVMHWAIHGPYPLKPKIDQLLEIFLTGAACEEVRSSILAQSPRP